MEKLKPIWLVLLVVIALSSCQNKTVALLSKKWDCVQVENLLPENTRFQTAADSANAVQLQSVLQSINWTFKNNLEYECSVDSRITIKGSYELLDNDKTLICTPETKNSINRYTINTLTENELILSGIANNSRLVLYFRPH